jgi:hypothetical protein
MSAAGPRALYLAVVQFVFVSTWTIYIVFLPELLLRAGIDKAWLPRIVIADQVLMAIFDLAFGIAAARGMQRYGRIAPLVLGVSLVSCLAFLLLPQMAATAPLLLVLTVIWVITSSALRAPLYALLSRHAAAPGKAALAGMMTLGMAGAGMIAPWLGAQLKPLDPTLPFALSSLALAALVLPLAAAERAAGLKADAGEMIAPLPALPAPVFFALRLAAALGFQIFFNLGAAPAYLRHYGPGDLHWLMPMFWLGVAGGSVLASATTTRWPAEGVFAAGALIAAAAALLFGMTTSGALLPAAQLLGGIGWGLALCKAFAVAERYLPAPNSAAMLGGLFAMLALATVARISLNAAGLAEAALPLPAALWLFAAGGMGMALLRAGKRRSPQVG